MKKFMLFIVLILSLIYVSCVHQTAQKTTSSAATALATSNLPVLISLNGFSIADADKMVFKFKTGRTTDDKSKTNVWLSKSFFHKICLLLDDENADGVRIYFARDTNDNDNNIVITTTRDLGTNANAPSGANHLDYFEHSAPFLGTAQSNGDIIVDHGPTVSRPSVNGALLYNSVSPCTSGDTCSILPGHDLSCSEAYLWVQNYSLALSDTSNTRCEWFGKPLMKALDKEIQKNGPDGIRIYFAKRTGDQRLVFIMVTTSPVNGFHQDYYNCFQGSRNNVAGDNGEQCPNNCGGATLPN